uniref:Uncharacterized protein n=1 Tax=Sus scrofa TaxID=9823 RepID=A0A8D0X6B8_PIG
MVSSVVGFYSSPLFRGLRPRWHDTAMTQIIGNCVCLLVLSSALPVFSRTLGKYYLHSSTFTSFSQWRSTTLPQIFLWGGSSNKHSNFIFLFFLSFCHFLGRSRGIWKFPG